ncbi:helical backbone metal receptor [Terrimonas alba]|uniref:helical backbone metal receptor n=1 Tax=Terrimonas alba TaxID=3349636 RepID=UPI0035F37640
MFSFTDQTGRTVSLATTPRRIVSLVPSQTELLCSLGLDEEVVAITKFCVHPAEWFYSKIRVGGTKKINLSTIHQLAPDLIIANKEENVKEQVEELAKFYPVWVSDINNLGDAYDMIEQIGLITNRANKSKELITLIKEGFNQLPLPDSPLGGGGTCYLIWNDPYMTVGGDTFINSMLDAAGLKNVFADKARYPEVSIDELKAQNLKLLLLSSEPFPFKQKHAEQLQPHLPDTKILLVDGEMFSWYGSRLQYAPRYFMELQRLIVES